MQPRARRGKDERFPFLLFLRSLVLSLSSLSLLSSEEEASDEDEQVKEELLFIFFFAARRSDAASGSAESRLGTSVALAVTLPRGIAPRAGLSGIAGGGQVGKKFIASAAEEEGEEGEEGPSQEELVAVAGGWRSSAVVSASTGNPGLRSKSTPPILTTMRPERSTRTLPRVPGWRSEALASAAVVSLFFPFVAAFFPAAAKAAATGGERLPPKEAPAAARVGRREGTWSRQKPFSSSSSPEPKAERGTVVGWDVFFFRF